ncbi:uncharacterized mitochondrial protein AtMg00810-like [Solanum dulcamara]|uniref:uncharacterized mitochondrial protein AtMg00810-like n=1 Tax=Solanum dulcamara TaxID=45834 RepID=UPI0024857989|nr:uncharacterized mitochondrial protein AtMg00810-like [Solanum dulcamara]
MDVYNAFLQRDLYEKVYMTIPEGFSNKARKSGQKEGDKTAIVLVYVDDLLLIGTDQSMIQYTKKALHTTFKIKNLGELMYFLGIEFARNKDRILMHQRKYALELEADMGLSGAKLVLTLIDQAQKLTTTEFDKYVPLAHEDLLLKDPTSYQKLIGRVYCDADWGACVNSRRSITDCFVHYGNSPISWRSKKQATLSRSSAEGEYRAMASSVAVVIAVNLVFHKRTKHIDIECHFTRDKIQEGLIATAYLPSTEPADLFTKGLGRSLHLHLLSKLGMKNVFIAPSLKGSVKELITCVDVP